MKTATIENGIRGYHSEFDRPDSYYEAIDFPTIGTYRDWLKFKDQNTMIYDKRWQAACEVIDIIAKRLGIDTETCGLSLYGADWDSKTKTASSPLADKLEDLLDRSGDKVKLKKQIADLENENSVLRSVLGK